MASANRTLFRKLFDFVTNPPASSGEVDGSLGDLRVSLPSELTLSVQSVDSTIWRTRDGDELTISRGTVPPDFPDSLEVDAVRAYGRRLAATADGGLLSADVHEAGGLRCLQVIYKMHRLPAYAYTGLLMVPAGGLLYTIAVVTMERGTTGVRDSIASVLLLQRGELKIPTGPPPETGGGVPLEGWRVDPYDPDYPGTILRSRADAAEFDELLPDHPLSWLRRLLPALRGNIRIATDRPA
jgi:hypothetical protein